MHVSMYCSGTVTDLLCSLVFSCFSDFSFDKSCVSQLFSIWYLERAAFENLSKRKDLIVKAADKGGALVVWRADLYQKETLQQLSDTSFLLKSIKISLPLINKLSRALLTTL